MVNQTPLDSFQRRNRSSSALDLRPKLENIAPPKASSKDEKTDSEDVTAKIKALIEKVESVAKPPPKLSEPCKEIRALPGVWKEKSRAFGDEAFDPIPRTVGDHNYTKYLEDHNNKFELDKREFEEEEEEVKDVVENIEAPPEPPPAEEMKKDKSPGKRTPDFLIAKRYQEENLKHQPLPDVIEDPVFKALGSSRHPNPGCQLNLKPNAAAIGWRGYTAPGPTQCSKMRIYRPKTAVTDAVKGPKDQRPKTSDPKTEKHFSQMELAICWDLIPEDPSDEPKRSPHIDGSNGSVAPAVFSIVKPESGEEGPKQSFNGSPQAVAERILPDIQSDNAANLPSHNNDTVPVPINTNKEAIMTHIKPASNSPGSYKKQGTPNSLNSITSSAAEIARKNPKTAWTGTDTSKTLSRRLLDLQKENSNPNIMNRGIESWRNSIDSDTSHLSRKKQYQSSPNLVSAGCQTNRRCSGSNCGTEKSSSKGSDGSGKEPKTNRKKIRSCDYCDRADSNPGCNRNQEKSEFKCAFKAGVPNNGSSNSTTPPSEKQLKIPKMRLPYAKRSYSISTLIPPFSLWPDHHGQDYPDHWRLASVYQHSYKPIDYRKKSLLASVYQ
ncbi:UNVERIFIED_CONTAM: hypothetical protein PYX00_009536 [Menopon gallinae]|uniref:DUF4812 domain-containing protein n=1 Tax=Menopon gallinae TaxID=328185 RepID=A0AAW2HBZ3_9NEOP